MRLASMINAVDLHCCGEPGRVIVGGVRDVPGMIVNVLVGVSVDRCGMLDAGSKELRGELRGAPPDGGVAPCVAQDAPAKASVESKARCFKNA